MIWTLDLIAKRVAYGANYNIDIAALQGNSDLFMTFIDDAQQDVAEPILDVRPDLLSNFFDLTLDGSEEYYMPDQIPFDYEWILWAEDITDANNPLKTIGERWYNRMQYKENSIISSRTVWYIRDQYVVFPERNRPTTGTYRFWYTRRPVGLFYGTVGAGNTSTTIVLPSTSTLGEISTVDDYYNGAKIRAGSETKLITDYVGSTKTATVSAWTTTPTDSTTVCYLMSNLPERVHYLIADFAIEKIKLANDDDIGQIASKNKTNMDKYIKRIELAHKQGAEYVQRVPRD